MICYAVKINKTNRYVEYCDECWYETTNEPLYLFSYEKAKNITQLMRKHYQYKFTIIGNDGSVEEVNFLSKGNPMKTESQPKKKKFTFKTSEIKLNK